MRINCIDVSDLADQHLRAEWVEFLMLGPYIKRSTNSKNGLVLSKSKKYILGTGHARFFYDKLTYVENRYKEIASEMNRRGFKANPSLCLNEFPKSLFNDWTPTEEDKITNLKRIVKRIYKKPHWYKYHKKDIDNWKHFYEDKYDHEFENVK